MAVLRVLLALLVLRYALAAPVKEKSLDNVPALIFPDEPPYPESASKMVGYIKCPESFVSNQTTILLVHGTGSDMEETFGAAYVQSLAADGYQNICGVSLPQRSMGDAQETAARVAYLIHYVAHLNNGFGISLIGHSQGNIDIQWALTFWPSTRTAVRQFISLAGAFRGTAIAKPFCFFTACLPSIHQQATGSKFVDALAKHGGLKPWVPTTSIYSVMDEILQPEFPLSHATSRLDARPDVPLYVTSVQTHCPFDFSGHILLLTDGVAYAIVKDALTSGTVADHARLGKLQAMCHTPMPKISSSLLKELKAAIKTGLSFLLGNGAIMSRKEPALKPYAL